MENIEHIIQPGVFYIHKIDHRNGNPNKSQWTINEAEERKSFRRAFNSWRDSNHTCWGLHFEDGHVAYLGKTKRSAPEQRDLFIAKFIDGNRNNIWHGYPADHVLNQQDIPPEAVLKMWLDFQYLRPAVVRKVSRGQKCKP